MKRLSWAGVFLIAFLLANVSAFATNGDRLISSGGAARSMGGVGIASPLDTIGAIFSNPAAICSSYCFKDYAYDISTTFFMPTTKTEIYINGEVDTKAESDADFFVIPAIGMTWKTSERSRVGLGVFGVSGMGVNYRNTSVDDSYTAMPAYPYASGIYTELQAMKIAPNFALRLDDNWSVGAALHFGYGSLDMNSGTSDDYPIGYQLGIIYSETPLSIGLTYMSPQKARYKTVADFDSDGDYDSLELESPEMWGAGVSYKWDKLLGEFDLKYYDWDNAAGYSDFNWRSQLVYSIGFQYEFSPKWLLRFGYNHGKSPLRVFDNFDGTQNVTVQGKTMKKYYYETFRLVGFPAIVEDHFTLGAVFHKSTNFSVGLGLMYAPEETIEENGTDAMGNQAKIKSSLKEFSTELTFLWRF